MTDRLTHPQIEKLITQVLLPFYHVRRDIPLPIGERRLENDAEHSWSLAFLASCLAPQIDKGLDVGKVCQFAIVHDLVEVYAGDTAVHGNADHIRTKAAREEAAAKKIATEFSHMPWITETIATYEQRDCNEAKFVYALDKYLPVFFDYLDKSRYFREKKMSLAAYNQSLEEHRQKAHMHPTVGKYYDEVRALVDTHPEYFYDS
ncbi:MAG TPA: HD domain-containing protein [Candidatus Saccharimonadia bacterium]|nr:HD domain-containing protein [Candidatus Saccharimonadia bacterium]